MTVKVYALSTCPWCKKVKKLLDDEGVSYDVFDVDLLTGADQDKAVAEVEKLTGKRSFPVTVINDEYFVGYKESDILGALKNEK